MLALQYACLVGGTCHAVMNVYVAGQCPGNVPLYYIRPHMHAGGCAVVIHDIHTQTAPPTMRRRRAGYHSLDSGETSFGASEPARRRSSVVRMSRAKRGMHACTESTSSIYMRLHMQTTIAVSHKFSRPMCKAHQHTNHLCIHPCMSTCQQHNHIPHKIAVQRNLQASHVKSPQRLTQHARSPPRTQPSGACEGIGCHVRALMVLHPPGSGMPS